MKKTGFYRNCERCTEPFWVYQYYKERKYCSTSCSNKSNASKQSTTKRSKSVLNPKRQFDDWQYIEWRNVCLARDNKVCQHCSKDVSKKNQAVVHHIKSWEDAPELRVEVSNGITLCRGCHNKIHILPNRKVNHGF